MSSLNWRITFIEVSGLERVILHVDQNNFFASVECLYDHNLKKIPMAVGGDVEKRHGIVLAKNALAKRFGVQTGEPLWQARQKCPQIVFVPPHFERYIKYSKKAKKIYAQYTNQVESFGLDECWLDVTASQFGSGKEIADELRQRIRLELGLSVSVGVSFNKVFAKLGSDSPKPDATTVISRDNFRDIVWPKPVKELLYVGRATERNLCQKGIFTIGALAQTEPEIIESWLGKHGLNIWRFANGLDYSPVAPVDRTIPAKSIGNSTTTPRDLLTDEEVKITMTVLCESVAARLREHHLNCSTVQISIRDNELYSYERQVKLPFPSCVSAVILEKAFELYKQNHTSGKPIRSIGVTACHLTEAETVQLSLLPEERKIQRLGDLACAVDGLRRRFGNRCLRPGSLLVDRSLSGLDPQTEHTVHPVAFINGGM